MHATREITHFAATIGFFDGVHRGHLYLLNRLRSYAEQHGLPWAVITFRQHPRQVLQQDYVPQLLTTPEEKEQLLLNAGADRVVMLDFTREFAALSARDFMAYMHSELGVTHLLTGYDNRFGHNRSEGFADYVAYGHELGMVVEAFDALAENEVNISSSAIRRLLTAGDIATANAFLGRPYTFSGEVVHGRGEGRKIGFPTANMRQPQWQHIPHTGVYAVKVWVEGYSEEFRGMMNIGRRPTYGNLDLALEVNILDFDADIYGRQITVSFTKYLRPECKFASLAELQQQLAKDKAASRAAL